LAEPEQATQWGALGEALRGLLQEQPHSDELVRRLTLGGSIPTPLEKRRTSNGCR
jgi:hypothetical protein